MGLSRQHRLSFRHPTSPGKVAHYAIRLRQGILLASLLLTLLSAAGLVAAPTVYTEVKAQFQAVQRQLVELQRLTLVAHPELQRLQSELAAALSAEMAKQGVDAVQLQQAIDGDRRRLLVERLPPLERDRLLTAIAQRQRALAMARDQAARSAPLRRLKRHYEERLLAAMRADHSQLEALLVEARRLQRHIQGVIVPLQGTINR